VYATPVSAPADCSSPRLREALRAHGQEHLLAWLPDVQDARALSDVERQDRARLIAQLESLDFDLISKLFAAGRSPAHSDYAALAARAEPPPAIRLGAAGNRFDPTEARRKGWELLRAGTVGAVLVAGGQGTRLGFPHPKGMFPIGPVSGASLFQILCEKLLAISQAAGKPIPLYVMTSAATTEETHRFFGLHQYFGLRDVFFFQQGNMPAVDAESGRLLLADKGFLSLSPDGHGGLLAALAGNGLLEDMRRRGLAHLFYFQVDNPLVGMCDPEFLGYHALAGSELSTQVVAKQVPDERVGNVVSVDGRLRIIEYSDLPAEAGQRRNPDGSLRLWAGSTAIHAFDLQFLERMAAAADALPFHIARKKVPYLDDSGRLVEPAAPNALKFERFIFDLLPAAERAIVVEVDAAEHFAPVKNAPGEPRDTPESVQAQMIALHRRWLEAAGAKVARDAVVEISPLFALDEWEVRGRIGPGTVVEGRRLFGPQ
jgi:UDP-N-acetylglucosamine/UDP-N-acetylgalactosamine diphosphorylase